MYTLVLHMCVYVRERGDSVRKKGRGGQRGWAGSRAVKAHEYSYSEFCLSKQNMTKMKSVILVSIYSRKHKRKLSYN